MRLLVLAAARRQLDPAPARAPRPGDVTLPWPKIPNTPAKSATSLVDDPVRCAISNRTIACAVVSRTICIGGHGRDAGAALLGRLCSLPSLVVDLQAMLDAEAALAQASADAGVVPRDAAAEIAAACRAELYDPAALAAAARDAGNPAIPLVRALTARLSPAAAAHVHRGATAGPDRHGARADGAADAPDDRGRSRPGRRRRGRVGARGRPGRRRWQAARCCSRRCRSRSA